MVNRRRRNNSRPGLDKQRERNIPPPRPQRPVVKKPSPPSRETMNQLLSACGIRLPPGPLDLLWRYHGLLRANNEDHDLTRLVRFESIVLKHYVDCMIVGHYVKLPSPLADIGTGAGFPGIPLKIRYPGIELVLVEQRPRRVAFLERVSRELKLQKVSVIAHKATPRRFVTPVQGVITRAFESISETLDRVTNALEVGGLAIFMKGPAGEAEVQPALDRHGREYELVQSEAYDLPGTDNHRRLYVLRRTGKLHHGGTENGIF